MTRNIAFVEEESLFGVFLECVCGMVYHMVWYHMVWYHMVPYHARTHTPKTLNTVLSTMVLCTYIDTYVHVHTPGCKLILLQFANLSPLQGKKYVPDAFSKQPKWEIAAPDQFPLK